MSINHIEAIPEELLLKILTFLPNLKVHELLTVSTSLSKLIADNFFLSSDYKKSFLPYLKSVNAEIEEANKYMRTGFRHLSEDYSYLSYRSLAAAITISLCVIRPLLFKYVLDPLLCNVEGKNLNDPNERNNHFTCIGNYRLAIYITIIIPLVLLAYKYMFTKMYHARNLNNNLDINILIKVKEFIEKYPLIFCDQQKNRRFLESIQKNQNQQLFSELNKHLSSVVQNINLTKQEIKASVGTYSKHGLSISTANSSLNFWANASLKEYNNRFTVAKKLSFHFKETNEQTASSSNFSGLSL